MNQIKQGYKQTKVGIIPENWDVVKLGKIGDLIGGGTPSTKNENFWSGNIPWISSSDLNENSIYDISISRFINEEAIKNSATKLIPHKSILIVSRVGVGKIAINNQPLCTSQDFQSLILKTDNYIFLAYKIKKEIQKLIACNQGTSIKGFVKDDLSNLQIPLPPLKEQEKIAQILTTWDEAITKQTELLEAKELQKKALMQKLLSGEVRFSGFTDEWEEVRLGEIGNPFNGLSGKTGEDFGTGEAKYITYKNIFDNSKIKLDIFESVEIADDEKQNLVKFGDIFFTVSSETPEEVGMSSVLLDNVSNIYLNSFCFGYRLNSFNILDPYFARFYFRSFQMRDKISRLAQGSTRFNLSKNEIMKLRFKLPSLQEQQKIAEVLILSDNEIDLLKNSLVELKQQKKALMQKLLTGEVRVKV